MKKNILEWVVFMTGAAVMLIELIGSRLLAPFFGTSLVVWTSLIGTVLGSMSLGYWWGGRLADRQANFTTLARLVIVPGVCALLIALLEVFVLSSLQVFVPHLQLGSLIACIVLFAVPSFFLGSVPPYAVRLKLFSMRGSGQVVGNMFAISTIGSIVGTFAAGFLLIPHFGNTVLLCAVTALLLATSFLIDAKAFLRVRLSLLIVLVATFLSLDALKSNLFGQDFVDVNTVYNRVWIYDQIDDQEGKVLRVMKIGSEFHGAEVLEESDMVLDYNRFFRLAGHFKPEIKRSLIIGGGAYSFPMKHLEDFPEASVDVVELDPGITALARKYFSLKDHANLRILHEDGRTFINRAQTLYDAIFVDAFKSITVPYQLTTVEAMRHFDRLLADDGVLMINVGCALKGDKSKFLRAELATLKAVFPQVLIFPVQDPEDLGRFQNIIVVALKSEKFPKLYSNDRKLHTYLKNYLDHELELDLPVLTDEYAPVNYYVSSANHVPAKESNPIISRLKDKLKREP